MRQDDFLKMVNLTHRKEHFHIKPQSWKQKFIEKHSESSQILKRGYLLRKTIIGPIWDKLWFVLEKKGRRAVLRMFHVT